MFGARANPKKCSYLVKTKFEWFLIECVLSKQCVRGSLWGRVCVSRFEFLPFYVMLHLYDRAICNGLMGHF